MTKAGCERALRLVGYALLVCLATLVLGAYAWVYAPAVEPGRLRAGAPVDVSGTIATYANDAVTVTSLGGERRVVHLTPSTAVVEIDVPATVASLRPGRSVAIQCAHELADGSAVASGIMVWGGG
jgi:hypothetical protein